MAGPLRGISLRIVTDEHKGEVVEGANDGRIDRCTQTKSNVEEIQQ